MIKKRYTLKAGASQHSEIVTLEKLGFKQEGNRSPYYFTTNSYSEMMNCIDLLMEEDYELGWVLTKRV